MGSGYGDMTAVALAEKARRYIQEKKFATLPAKIDAAVEEYSHLHQMKTWNGSGKSLTTDGRCRSDIRIWISNHPSRHPNRNHSYQRSHRLLRYLSCCVYA